MKISRQLIHHPKRSALQEKSSMGKGQLVDCNLQQHFAENVGIGCQEMLLTAHIVGQYPKSKNIRCRQRRPLE